MKTKFKIENPDSIPMTLTITMPAAKWKQLRAQLETTYPSWQLSRAISEMVDSADAAFSATIEVEL
jgi:hypothetical protein